jgi:hypothetical protein
VKQSCRNTEKDLLFRNQAKTNLSELAFAMVFLLAKAIKDSKGNMDG